MRLRQVPRDGEPTGGGEVDLVRGTVRIVGLALALLLVPTFAVAQDAGLERELDETVDEREQVLEDLGEMRVEEGDARERLAAIDAELDRAEAALVELRQRLEKVEAARDEAIEAAAEARAHLDRVLRELAIAESELADTKGQLNARIRSAYMYGQVSFVDAFTGTNDLVDFLNTSTYVTHVIDGDRQLVMDVESLLADVETRRVDAEVARLEADQQASDANAATRAAELAAAEQEEATREVRRQRVQRAEALEELRTDRAAMEGHLAGLEAEEARIEAQLAEIARQQELERQRLEAERLRAEEERRARQASKACEAARAGGDEGHILEVCGPDDPAADVDDGQWLRPVPGRLTSPFGPRWGRNHNGVDLAGGVGSSVVAARSGTVVHVTQGCHPTSSWGCGGGFGNYVTVAHPGGMATIYAHLSTVAVGLGQGLSAGQALGAVGNSGNSYGPHLHFETREAGSPRNPCGYIGC